MFYEADSVEDFIKPSLRKQILARRLKLDTLAMGQLFFCYICEASFLAQIGLNNRIFMSVKVSKCRRC